MADYSYYRKLLKEGRYINIASISNIDGILQPHCTVVFFHATSEGLFWTSARNSQHSQNVMWFPTTFITLFEENLKEGTGAGKGLYFEGLVHVVTDLEEINRAKTLSTEKANRDRDAEHKLSVPDPMVFVGNSVRAVYHFRPKRVWTNTWSPQTGDGRKELDLEELFKYFKA